MKEEEIRHSKNEEVEISPNDVHEFLADMMNQSRFNWSSHSYPVTLNA